MRNDLSPACEDRLMRLVALLEVLEQGYKGCLNQYSDLNIKELKLVNFLSSQERMKMKDVSSVLNVPASTTTYIVDKMVEKGYIKRIHGHSDRRAA